jgi:integrase
VTSEATAIQRRLGKASTKLTALEEEILLQGPRWGLLKRGGNAFIEALKPFAGQKATVVICGQGEPERWLFEQVLLDRLAKQDGARDTNHGRIVGEVQKLDNLRAARKEQYSTLLLMASASGLRCSELLALRVNDIDFDASSIRVDESSDQRTAGKIGPRKNATAYRTVLLHDSEGQKALTELRRFIKPDATPDRLFFRSKKNGPLRETTILNQCLHPALDALRFELAGLHAFRVGCNRRWELVGLAPAVIGQQMVIHLRP